MLSDSAHLGEYGSASAASIREHYDSMALIYRTFWGDHIHHGLFTGGDESPEEAQVAMLEHCISLLGLHAGNDVLDVGCGHGGTAVYLAQTRGCRVQAVTISETQAKLAQEHAQRAGVDGVCDFQIGNADLLDFGIATHGAIWTMESSEHFRDKARYIRRAAAALRPGGSLLIAAWTGSMADANVRAVAQAFLCPELQPAYAYAAQMEAAGLVVRAREDLTRNVVKTWEVCRDHAQTAANVVRLLQGPVREFIAGIDTILDAYRSGALTYTVLVGDKPGARA